MKTKIILLVLSITVTILSLNSCSKHKAGSGSKTSAYGNTDSHNVGTNCMGCHGSGGSNDYWWVVAGTVYRPDSTDLNPNSSVYFYTAANGGGSVVLTLPVDAKANFYTSGAVSFGTGLYPAVKSSSGMIRYMGTSITQGNCNGCHTSSNRIIVN